MQPGKREQPEPAAERAPLPLWRGRDGLRVQDRLLGHSGSCRSCGRRVRIKFRISVARRTDDADVCKTGNIVAFLKKMNQHGTFNFCFLVECSLVGFISK